MSHSALLAKTRELVSAAEIMGALGAELRLRQMGKDGDPRVRGALQAVLRNLEPGLLDGLDSGQIAAIIGQVTYALQEALDLIHEPERAPGWGYKDPTILQERGRGSRAAARYFANLAKQRPALAGLLGNCRFLDIGTGVGWLAIEAAKTWPGMRVVWSGHLGAVVTACRNQHRGRGFAGTDHPSSPKRHRDRRRGRFRPCLAAEPISVSRGCRQRSAAGRPCAGAGRISPVWDVW